MKSRRQFGTIRKLPSGRWQARHRDTVTNRLLNAPTTFATKAAANRYLATVETDIARGVWHDPRQGDLTFAEWVQRYLSVAGHKAATTRSRDETVLSRIHRRACVLRCAYPRRVPSEQG
ncbi:MAG: hypothetical protein M3Q30_23300, partial [Actinomycetota bacterium]|nr:hypothetical protein [Actinomycetota bacterium]